MPPSRLDIFGQAFEAAAIGLGILSPGGRWLRVNAQLCNILGYSREEIETVPFDFQTPTSPFVPVESEERRYRHKDGSERWVLLSLSQVAEHPGEPLCTLVQMQDVTAFRAIEERYRTAARELESQRGKLLRANKQLLELSRIDPLTGIFNRRVFDERLVGWVSVAKRFGRPLSLLMIDVDNFKRYNDDFGHADGDEVLRRVAQLIQQGCRESDIPARFGGEEFAVVCPETSKYGAFELAERIRRSIHEEPFPRRQLTISVGVASLESDATGEQLVRAADHALYESKALGRDRTCTYD